MPKGCKAEPEAPSAFGMLERECEEDVDVQDDADGVLFYVNKTGFPISQSTWKRMWRHASKLYPDGKGMMKKVRGSHSLPEVPVPQAPTSFPINTLIPERLDTVQKYMSELQYNHTGTQFFEIRKNRPLSGLMDSAREMIREALPIKCLEAVILSLHVVLGVFYNGMYGALGMSRRQDLMYKPLHFKTLTRLITDYIKCYKQYFHVVRKVKVGLPIPHDSHSFEPIVWKHISLSFPDEDREKTSHILEKHARDMRSQTRRQTALAAVYMPHKLRSLTAGQSNNLPVTPPGTTKPKASHKPKKTKEKTIKSQGKIVRHSSTTEDEDKEELTANSETTATTSQYQIRV